MVICVGRLEVTSSAPGSCSASGADVLPQVSGLKGHPLWGGFASHCFMAFSMALAVRQKYYDLASLFHKSRHLKSGSRYLNA